MARRHRELPDKSFPGKPSKRKVSTLHRRTAQRKRPRELPRSRERDFISVLSSALAILRESGLNYVITGGTVLPFYGRVRTTTDIDIMVEYDEDKLRHLVDVLNKAGFTISWERVKHPIDEKTHFTVLDKFSPYRLDIKVLQSGENLPRTVEVKLYGRSTHIVAPEDLVTYKLQFGSETDIEDARSIIISKGKILKLDHMLKKAEELSVKDQLIKLLK